ncbi:hypothetical protein [Elongatibacter sediminis]|uniref:Uncharacterized protein n=1 Tax=Elongatibacter sediminis TaxID=3119006 RepID=A0AAW9R4M0_9GAMM
MVSVHRSMFHLGLVFASLGFAPAALAVPPVSQLFENCRDEARVLYAQDGESVRVRLDDMRRSGRELQLTVVTPAGETLRAVCRVDRKTAEVLALEAVGSAPEPERLAAADKR